MRCQISDNLGSVQILSLPRLGEGQLTYGLLTVQTILDELDVSREMYVSKVAMAIEDDHAA
jgi:hypothetical protein